MKKLLITSSIVALAMIGFIVVLCILPANGNACWKNNKECMMSDGNGMCTVEMDSSCADGKMRKEIRVMMNGDHDMNCQMGGNSCPKDKGSCNMGHGGQMMMGGMGGGCCCCCCRMMCGGGDMMMMHGGKDSMKMMMKMDTVKKTITK